MNTNELKYVIMFYLQFKESVTIYKNLIDQKSPKLDIKD